MRNDKDKRESQRFFDHLVEFVSDCSEQSTEELERELRQDGIDTDALVKSVESLVDTQLNQARLSWQAEAREKSQQVIEKLAAIPEKVRTTLTRAELVECIQSLITVHGYQVSWEHRNLETLTDEDLQATLENLEELITLNRGPASSDQDLEQ